MTSVASNHPAIRAARARGLRVERSLAPGTYTWLLVLVGLANFIGLVMVLSASSVQGLADFGSTWGYFQRQVGWVLIGVVALAATMRVDYRRWSRYRVPLLVVAAALLVLVLVPGIGSRINGSRRWLGAGGFTFQPSELAKFALLIHVSHVLAVAHRRRATADAHHTLWPVLVVFGLFGLLVLVEPDLGTTAVMGAIVFCLLWIAGVPGRWMAGVAGTGAFSLLVLGLAAGYRRERLLTFLDPWADAQNAGYQIVQSLVGLGSGGLTGVGLGASRAKWGFLPNAHTDFIYAIIGEELGLVGAVAVLALFIGLGIFGVRAAVHAPDRLGLLLAGGITTWILVQAFVNIGAVIGVLPVTGVPLPFISFGGTALVTTMAATGVLLNIARQGTASRVRTRPAE